MSRRLVRMPVVQIKPWGLSVIQIWENLRRSQNTLEEWRAMIVSLQVIMYAS